MSQKAKDKMASAIWEHGREKGKITKAINLLQDIKSLKDDYIIEDAIERLKQERERLKKTNPLD